MNEFEISKLQHERAQQAADLRDQGLTYKEIGAKIGSVKDEAQPVSATSARVMAIRGYRLREQGTPKLGDWRDDLSKRAINCLLAEGLEAPKEVCEKIETGEIWDIPNMGRTTISQIQAALEKHHSELSPRLIAFEDSESWTDGLNKKIANALKERGFDSVESVAVAIEDCETRGIAGLGPVFYGQLLRWLAEQDAGFPERLKTQAHEQMNRATRTGNLADYFRVKHYLDNYIGAVSPNA